jgi:hypothetical protein
VAEASEDVDLMIDDYLDGRMDVTARVQFEERMNRDPQLRNKVLSATQSVSMVQQALGWMTPGEEFDEQVQGKITSITQSGLNFHPAGIASDRNLTSDDPDAKLLADPEASREKQRLIILTIVAVVLFVLATLAIGYSITQGMKKKDAESTERRDK